MTQLTKKEIINILHLKDQVALGDLLDSLLDVYKAAEYHNFFSHLVLPDFLQKSIGPPLMRLPSFATLEEKENHSRLIASRKPEGIGYIAEAMHSDMRQLASNTGKLFVPEIAQRVSQKNLGARFDPEDIVPGLRGIDTATIDLGDGKLRIDHPKIVYTAFMLGAEARAHLTRSEEEQDLLTHSVGVLKQSYLSTCRLLDIIGGAMQNDPNYAGKTPAKFGLAPKIDKIAESFHKRQKEWRDAYNFIYVITQGELTPRLQSLKWAIEGKEKPKAGIEIKTPADAAAALFGLCTLVKETTDSTRFCCQWLAETPAQKAPALLALPEFQQLLQQIMDLADERKPRNERDFIHEIIGLLQEFRISHRPSVNPWTTRSRAGNDSRTIP